MKVLACLPFLVSVSLFAAKPAPSPTPNPTPFEAAIVYVQQRSTGSYSTRDLMVTNAAGTQTRTLLAGTSTAQHNQPSVSPDGTRVVFKSTIAGPGLYVIPVDGTQAPSLLVPLAGDTSTIGASWSPLFPPDESHPEGRQFVAFSDASGGSTLWSSPDQDLFLAEVTADGSLVEGSVRQLTDTDDVVETVPEWSRDGSRISTIVETTGNVAAVRAHDIDLENGILGPPVTLASWAGLPNILMSTRPKWNRSASAAGDVVVFGVRTSSGNFDIWYARADGSGTGQLVNIANSYDHSAAFSPDDARVVFVHQPTSGGGRKRLMFVTNAAGVIAGAGSVAPVYSSTSVSSDSKITDFFACDWK